MKFKIELGGWCIILFIIFLVLKLTNTIAWSWWWVTSPLWISAVVFIVLFLVLVIIAFIDNLIH